jgi:DNA helicase HerA-like ATPase
MAQLLDTNDMLFHSLIVGGTGSGKTNAVLYMLDLLFRKKAEGTPRPALFLFDPAGDASLDLLRAIPKSEWSRVAIIDPQYVTFGFNLLSLPEGLEASERPQVTHAMVDEFSVLLSDAFNTDASNAPRLMWVFKGGLYFDYKITSDPTLWELYNIMLDFTKRSTREIEDMLNRQEVQKDIIKATMEAISKLPQDAYMPVLNRISNFVLPQSSITFRTFCNRKSTIDLEERMEPGKLTIFRMPPDLPSEFRRIFASAVVMKLYFASVKRAKKLEREGRPPVARTPVIFAADEFRDIAQLGILRTMLSQSRKYGLYLWMVAQSLSDIPDDLMGSIEANVGPVIAFRCSPDDATTLSKLLHPQNAKAIAELIPGLVDYAALVRKRPVGGKPMEPPFRVTFPKLREPACGYSEALDFMKVEMEARYGGAKGDTELLYKKVLEKARKERGECPLGDPFLWVPLAYLHVHGPMGFKPMSRVFEDRFSWERKVLRLALDRLKEKGKVLDTPSSGQFFVEIDPQTDMPVYKEPETDDEKRRARDVAYSVSPAAEEEFFRFGLDPPERAGGMLHVKVMEALLEDYWDRGYWCVWDRGDTGEPLADILCMPPVIVRGKAREGKSSIYVDPDQWDEEGAVPVEVETNPRANFEQLRANYAKNAAKYPLVRFVVPSIEHVSEVKRILEDKEKKTFEVVFKDVGLQRGEVERVLAEEAKARQEKAAESGSTAATATTAAVEEGQGQRLEPFDQAEPRKNELWVLARISLSGYPGRSTLGASMGKEVRQVSRYLDSLEAKGLLERHGNGYRATEKGAKLVASEGLTSSNLPAKPDGLRLDI